jgi:hypothetical protein
MVASYNLLSKAGLLWLYPPFQLCEASITTIKSFQLMMLKQIQTDCQDLLCHGSDEIIMDAVLSSFQFGESCCEDSSLGVQLIIRPSHHLQVSSLERL